MNCSTGSVTFQVVNLTNLNSLSTANVQGFTGTITPTLGTGTVVVSGVTFTNYQGFGSFDIIFSYSSGVQCTVEVKIAECCQTGTPTHLFIEDDIPAGTYSGTTWCYGDNILEDGVNFNNAEVQCATDAQLIVDIDAEVIFDETILSQLCEYRWDCIFLPSSTNTLSMVNSSQLEEALRGIYTTNNAELEIRDSYFTDNITSLKIEDYTTAGTTFGSHIQIDNVNFDHPYTLTSFGQHPSSTINMSSHFITGCSSSANFLAPVLILDSEQIGIGHRLLGTNTFTAVTQDITYISLVNSYARIRNNSFDGNVEYSVCSTGQSRLVFGGSQANAGNDFGSKVISHNSAEFFTHNNFSGGVEINTPYYQAVVPGGYTDGTNFEDGNVFTGGGLVVNGNAANAQVRALNNTFINSFAYFDNLWGVYSPALRSVIFLDNTMTNTSAATQNQLTILSCDEAVVADNIITNSTYTPSGTSPTPYGINLFGLYDGIVARNTINNFETGIYLEGNFGTTQFQCNSLSDNYNGFYLDYPDLDHQGSSTTPGMNEWYNSGNFDIDGNVTTPYAFTWHYNTSLSQLIPSINASNVGTGPTTNSGVVCGSLSIPPFRIVNNSGGEKRSPNSIEPEELEKEGKAHITLYPNPTNNFLKIVFPESYRKQNYSIYDFSGKLYNQSTVNSENVTLNIQSWPSGLYFLRVDGQTLRFIKE